MEFLASNPLLALCGILCIWPALVGAAGYYAGLTVSRRGRPRLVWENENGEPGLPYGNGGEL